MSFSSGSASRNPTDELALFQLGSLLCIACAVCLLRRHKRSCLGRISPLLLAHRLNSRCGQVDDPGLPLFTFFLESFHQKMRLVRQLLPLIDSETDWEESLDWLDKQQVILQIFVTSRSGADDDALDRSIMVKPSFLLLLLVALLISLWS